MIKLSEIFLKKIKNKNINNWSKRKGKNIKKIIKKCYHLNFSSLIKLSNLSNLYFKYLCRTENMNVCFPLYVKELNVFSNISSVTPNSSSLDPKSKPINYGIFLNISNNILNKNPYADTVPTIIKFSFRFIKSNLYSFANSSKAIFKSFFVTNSSSSLKLVGLTISPMRSMFSISSPSKLAIKKFSSILKILHICTQVNTFNSGVITHGR